MVNAKLLLIKNQSQINLNAGLLMCEKRMREKCVVNRNKKRKHNEGNDGDDHP